MNRIDPKVHRRSLLQFGAFCAAGWGLGSRATALRAQPTSFPDTDVPFVVTPDNVVLRMLDLARVSSHDVVYDLGSGDGRIVITAALRYGARGLGVEIDPNLVARARDNARKAAVEARATFETRDLFETDLSVPSVITMYLLPDVNLLLKPRLLALRPGVRLVSHDWDMGDWRPDEDVTVDAPDKPLGLQKKARLMLWIVPAQVAGQHVGRLDGQEVNLQIRQTYQRVDSGELQIGNERFRFGRETIIGSAVHLGGNHEAGQPVLLTASVATQKAERIDWRLTGRGRTELNFSTRRLVSG